MRLLYAILLAMSLVAVGVAEDAALVQDSLQAAINAGGTVYLKEGVYRQTVTIERSVNIVGMGSGRTVVDGDGKGSVFTIGKANPNIDVKLSGMIIRGGKNDIGGGINNFGRLTVEDSTVTGNTAEFGGGIFNHNGTSTLTIARVNITGNNVIYDGAGIYNSVGTLIIDGGNITGNTAEVGAGVFNDLGKVILKDGNITGNTATQRCGGILNDGSMDFEGGSVIKNTRGNVYNVPP
jgi:hypothetical protein